MSIEQKQKFFSIDARAIIQLGRDSIKEFTTALVELVKNCYDADADNVDIEIIVGGDRIRVADDGFGMTEEIIDDNWLRIGFSEKRKKKRSEKDRRKTGEKGIGRIAADRLGAQLTLLTNSKEGKPQGLEVNWDLFDVDNKKVSDVPLLVIEQPKPTLPNKSVYGTEILINKLRHKWELSDVEKLYHELTALIPPFTDDEKFKVTLTSDLDPKYKKLPVKSTFDDAAEIALQVEYDGKQQELTYYIENRRFPGQEYIKKIPVNQLITQDKNRKDKKLKCGPFEIKLYFFLRDASVLERSSYSKLSEFRQILDVNVGVKIYRDNVAVKPYGYAGSEFGDWLGLAARKAKDPAGVGRDSYSITPNQLVGAVFIGRDENAGLHDSAGREGLVENDEFFDLKDAVLGAIQVLESHRVEVTTKRQNPVNNKSAPEPKLSKTRKLDDINQSFGQVDQLFATVKTAIGKNDSASANATIDQSKKILEDIGHAVNETIVEMLNERRILNGLATLGISTAVFGHETESAISLLKQASQNAFDHIHLSPPFVEKAKKELVKVRKYSRQVGSWGEFALSRVTKEKRTNPVARKIEDIIEDVIRDVSPLVEASDITIGKDIIDEVYSKVFPLDIEAILFNLVTNAYQACTQVNTNRDIFIRLHREDRHNVKGYCLTVEDNGPGIAPEFIDRIWEPLFSTKIGSKKKKESGTGLGLTIVESIVTELNGEVTAGDSDTLNGAKFVVWLPKH